MPRPTARQAKPRSRTSSPAEAVGASETPKGTVGHLLGLVAEAFDSDQDAVADAIARIASGPKGEDSDPTRETILSYAKDPKVVMVKDKEVRRRNKLTPIHHKFAHLVMNFLDGRRSRRWQAASLKEPIKLKSWRNARAICKTVLKKERNRRYEGMLGSDPGSQATLGQIVGVYALCRQETSDQRYRQELMMLQNVGTTKIPRLHCTYVSEKVVTRGEAMLIGNVVYCSMSGTRADNTNEIGGMYLSHSANDELLSGFLAGAGTASKIPVVMPIVAVKIAGINRRIFEISDLGDEIILRSFRGVDADLSAVSGKLHDILSSQMKAVVFQAYECNAQLKNAFDNGTALIHSRLRAFCQSPPK
jgi:hypothetical protein